MVSWLKTRGLNTSSSLSLLSLCTQNEITFHYMPSKKRHNWGTIWKSPPIGGLVFGFCASIFVLRPPKFFWEGFCVCWVVSRNFLVVCRKMGGVKIKTTKNCVFYPKWPKFESKKKMRNDRIVHPTSLIWPQNSKKTHFKRFLMIFMIMWWILYFLCLSHCRTKNMFLSKKNNF